MQDDSSAIDVSRDATPAVKQQSSPSHLRQARADAARKLTKELQEVLQHASMALLRMSQPEAIQGLHSYCTMVFSPAYQLAHSAHEGNGSSSATDGDQQTLANGNVAAGQADAVHEFEWMRAVALQACDTITSSREHVACTVIASCAQIALVGWAASEAQMVCHTDIVQPKFVLFCNTPTLG